MENIKVILVKLKDVVVELVGGIKDLVIGVVVGIKDKVKKIVDIIKG